MRGAEIFALRASESDALAILPIRVHSVPNVCHEELPVQAVGLYKC